MSATKNLALAKLAVEYVQSQMTIGASNKLGDVISSGFRSITMVGSTRRERKDADGAILFWGSSPDSASQRKLFAQLRTVAQVAKVSGAGNCGEQAAMAFFFLHEIHRVKPLDYMSYARPGDHAFVVIGRKKDSRPSVPATWGRDAVVCDPWAGAAFTGKEVSTKLYAIERGHRFGSSLRLD